jgi:hypothetical protein
LGADLGGKIGCRLLDTLAERKADKTRDSDRFAGRLPGRFHHLRDPALAVDNEDLLQKYCLFIEFAQPALDHALDNRIGFAAPLRLLAQHGPLTVERRCGHGGRIEILRIGGGDMHR